jgi:hypothetical protein
MNLTEALEMTRRIPCRNTDDRKLQDQIENGIVELQARAAWHSNFWKDFKNSGADRLSDEQFEEVDRRTVEGDHLSKAVHEAVMTRLLIPRFVAVDEGK